MEIRFVGRTDVGKRRANNEDRYAVAGEIGLFLLADGMGGHASGEVASQLAVDTVRKHMEAFFAKGEAVPQIGPYLDGLSPESNQLANSIRLANRVIHGAAQGRPEYQGMGTTMVAVLARNDRATVAHVGDSRAYRIRGRGIAQISTDHSLVREQVAQGLISEAEARISQYRHVITRALGLEPMVEVDVAEHRVVPEDILLLCSDGLTDMVEEGMILQAVLAAGGEMDQACRDLIDLANAHGGEDNVTAVLLQFRKGGGGPARIAEARGGGGLWRRLWGRA